jgi:hypothetical protein
MITTLIGLGTRPHNAIRSRLTLARIPASVTIGLATLITLNHQWWTSTKPTTAARITAIAILLGAAIAYQAHELRGHGVTHWRLALRTIAIVTIGLCYAFVISYATLRVIAPLTTEDGDRLAGWWQHDPNTYHGAAPWWLLTLATAWSYTVGVFIQVVWDDRPITAPLGRMPRGTQ